MSVERDIQRAILTWLKVQYPKPDTKFWRVPIGPNIVGSSTRAKNPLASFPDILLLHRGRFIGMEIKAPGESLSPGQHDMREDIHDAGGLYFVCHSLEEAQAAMRAATGG